MEDQVHCPKCNSTQITANKKGFSGQRAFTGAVLTGGIGLLAGTIGSNKILITCLNCGHQFKPNIKIEPKGIIKLKDTESIDYSARAKLNKRIWAILSPIFGIVSIVLFVSDLYIAASIFLLFLIFSLIVVASKVNQ